VQEKTKEGTIDMVYYKCMDQDFLGDKHEHFQCFIDVVKDTIW
jgi:hypothetical protein